MRTAEEHIIHVCRKNLFYIQEPKNGVFTYEIIKKSINEARKEAIEECSRVALDYVSESEEILILDKKILSLINDLK